MFSRFQAKIRICGKRCHANILESRTKWFHRRMRIFLLLSFKRRREERKKIECIFPDIEGKPKGERRENPEWKIAANPRNDRARYMEGSESPKFIYS